MDHIETWQDILLAFLIALLIALYTAKAIKHFKESKEYNKSMDNLRKAWRGEGPFATREKERKGK